MEFALLATLALAYFVSGLLFAHKLRASKFADRESLSFDQIYERYFGASGLAKDIARELWDEAGASLKVDPKKLRPTDRFSDELHHHVSLFPILDLNHDWYLAATRRLRASHSSNEILENVRTLSDYVLAFAHLESGISKYD